MIARKIGPHYHLYFNRSSETAFGMLRDCGEGNITFECKDEDEGLFVCVQNSLTTAYGQAGNLSLNQMLAAVRLGYETYCDTISHHDAA